MNNLAHPGGEDLSLMVNVSELLVHKALQCLLVNLEKSEVLGVLWFPSGKVYLSEDRFSHLPRMLPT